MGEAVSEGVAAALPSNVTRVVTLPLSAPVRADSGGATGWPGPGWSGWRASGCGCGGAKGCGGAWACSARWCGRGAEKGSGSL
jgi:hypothetical protein